jgi:hypothetical protein
VAGHRSRKVDGDGRFSNPTFLHRNSDNTWLHE